MSEANAENGDGDGGDDAEALDLARGDVNAEDLNDLEAAINEIDFAARRASPEQMTRLRALSARLLDVIEQIEKGVRKRSEAQALTPEDEQKYERLLADGIAHAERGELDKAREDLEAAVRVDPDEPSGLFNLGVLYGKLGENAKGGFYGTSHGFDEIYVEKAAFCFERVLELDAKNAAALTNLAAIYDIRGDKDGAIDALKRALAIDPNEPKAREHLRELEESSRS
jgi:tetratricopeptide (TPR) repeat protein